MLEKYIENSKDEIINKVCSLINIPSVSEETNDPSIPFGDGAKKALDYALSLGKSLGFKTKNIDNYCGYIEFGEGKKLVGIIGHLDVVPSGDGWNSNPFRAKIENGKIYGRGSIDDKGPVIAALYAMKAVKDNLKINSRVRLILGLNEEKSWECISHYKKVEEWPTIGFSPDADFPCIYAEKGIETIYLKEDYTKYSNSPIQIYNIDCNNNAINVVPKYCKVDLKIDNSKNSIEKVTQFITSEISKFNYNIKIRKTSENTIELISEGIQAHAAHPDLGKNAISPLIIILNKTFIYFGSNCNLLNFFEENINTEYSGKSLGIDISDESGNLTLNVGNFTICENNLEIGLNLRVPVNTSLLNIAKKIQEKGNSYLIKTNIVKTQEPLYVPKENSLVRTLCNIYNNATNSNLEPIAIGGGTYARAFDNCISFGMNFPGDIDMCHQANEFVYIDKLILACKIYAKAIYELAK